MVRLLSAKDTFAGSERLIEAALIPSDKSSYSVALSQKDILKVDIN